MDLRLIGLAIGVALALLPAVDPVTSAAAQSSERASGPAADSPRIGEQRAIKIARRSPDAREALGESPDLHLSADRAADGDWEVGVFDDDRQLVEVIVSSSEPVVEESWTGHQVAWTMARGYEGSFGRSLNAPYVWLPLCVAFVLGLLDWRRLRRVAHLDLLVLTAGFGLSHLFFNRGEIGVSVPLAYLPLLYLLGRMLWAGWRGGDGLRPTIPTVYLAVAVLVLTGVRVGLNVLDSGVIDVGYAGVIGADRIMDGEPVHGSFPDDNHAGDTYGPVAYYAYVPFEQAFSWSGRFGDLPAAHAAAIFFDLATLAGLFLLGLRLGGPSGGRRLGTLLAFGWAACPYTAYVLESNSNDALVSLLVVAVLLVLSSPPARGALAALAAATKFAPAAIAPMLATYGATGGGVRAHARTALPFAAAFAAATAAVVAQTLVDPGLTTFWERTIGNQAGRESPFSIWGQEEGLGLLHNAVKAGAVTLALGLAFVPRRRGPATLAALAAAVLIATQLTAEHWFYLYIPWFLPLLLVALLAGAGTARDFRRAGSSG